MDLSRERCTVVILSSGGMGTTMGTDEEKTADVPQP